LLDLKWVRENPDVVRDAARRKRVQADVDGLLAADASHREVLTQVEELRAELKAASKELGRMSPEERAGALDVQKATKARLKELEGQEQELRARVQELCLWLPMPPAPEVPDGADDGENLEIARAGTPPAFDFEARDHVELGELLGIVDIPRGVRIAGTRNYLLLGDGARLEQAVLQLALEHMRQRGFELVSVPTLVSDACMTATGYFPGGEEQAYRCERDALNLVGTS
jgi:seryl-tRNA synthetase